VTSSYGFDVRGNRTYEDDDASSFDRRDYTYDQRRRVRTITGKYLRLGFPTNTWRDYRVTYAYDHRDRLVFRSYKDLTVGSESATFYYYDLRDRLVEVKFTSNIASPSTYSIYNFYWLGSRPVAQWTTNFPASTTARYFVHADEANRVLEMYDWPNSGDASLVWSQDPDAYGWDRLGAVGPYQPLRLNNLLFDDGTYARRSDPTFIRPALLVAKGTHYDPMTDSALKVNDGWPREPYALGVAAIHESMQAAPSTPGTTAREDQYHQDCPGGGGAPPPPGQDWPANTRDHRTSTDPPPPCGPPNPGDPPDKASCSFSFYDCQKCKWCWQTCMPKVWVSCIDFLDQQIKCMGRTYVEAGLTCSNACVCKFVLELPPCPAPSQMNQ
jgi:hypothetical protein